MAEALLLIKSFLRIRKLSGFRRTIHGMNEIGRQTSGAPLHMEQSLTRLLRKEVVRVWAETCDFQIQDLCGDREEILTIISH